MSVPREYQLIFSRVNSSRGGGQKASHGEASDTTHQSQIPCSSGAAPRGDSLLQRRGTSRKRRPLTASSSSHAKWAAEFTENARHEYTPQLLEERSMPAMHLQEGSICSAAKDDTCCSMCGCFQGHSNDELLWRAAGSNKPKPSAAVVSIPTFALDKVMLPDCKSQDELEAKLAKYVGLGLPQEHTSLSNDDLQLPVTQEATSEIVSSIFSVFCDTELMKLMVEDLQAVGTVPRLVAALTAFRRELGEKADKAVGENAGKEFSSALSQQTAAKLANRLHCHISHAWQQKQQKSGSLDGSDAAVMQLWRKLKQYGWLHETVASARRVDKVQGMLADISCGIESQKNRSKEILESLDFLQTQLRETKHRAHSLEERCKKNAAELDRMRKAFHARNERVQELEAELASNTMQGFGDMAAELGGVREELEELRKASQGLGIENRQLKADLEESERRRHNAEVDCEDVLLKLKEANEERQELLAFQARAVDAIRHQEIASLKQRIQHLEHSRGAGRGNAAQAQSQPSCDREEEASGVQAASRARARLEEAVARDATGFYASASNRGSSSGYVCAIPGFRGDSADSLPPDMEGPGSNTCERKLPSASSCPTGISMLDCSSIGLALKEPEEELVETCDPHDQGGADLPQQSETQDVGSTGRHAQTDQSQVKAPSREHSMSGGSGEPWTSDCQHGAQKPLRPSTAGAHSPKLRRERSLGHVSRAYPPWAQQLVAESSAPALGAASTKSSLMRSVMSVRYHQQQSSHVRTGNAAARHQARPDLKRAGSARHTSQTAAEELHSLMDPYTYHNVAQVSGRGANGAGLQIKGMKPTRMEDGAMTCLRPNGRIAVSQRP